ncbi:MAG: winged helix-turn-helix domain-containing protein [Faecalibacterium prausnitzii]
MIVDSARWRRICGGRTAPASVGAGGVSFDLSARRQRWRKLCPDPLESICEYLALHAGQTFTKEQIYEAVFGIDGTADDTAVTQHIKNIRAKLRAAGVPEPEKLLNTVWGVGYRWKSED